MRISPPRPALALISLLLAACGVREIDLAPPSPSGTTGGAPTPPVVGPGGDTTPTTITPGPAGPPPVTPPAPMGMGTVMPPSTDAAPASGGSPPSGVTV